MTWNKANGFEQVRVDGLENQNPNRTQTDFTQTD